MNFPSYSRYDYCVSCACDFLEAYNIDTYPINLFKIIDESPYALVPYSDIMKQFNCSIDLVIKKLKSDEGRTVYYDGIYTIAYNDVTKSPGRILFTLAHELGHICLNHMIDFSITEMPKSSNEHNMQRYQYKLLEREANAFARNILVPIPLYYYLKTKDAYSLQIHFGISYDAAIARIDLVTKDYQCSKKLGLYNRFMKIYSAFMDKKKCNNCEAGIIQHQGDYCPICGSKNTLQWGDGDKMKYPLLESHENGKVKECPICHNEETDIDGVYCQICSQKLINMCTNNSCDNYDRLPTNARFCPKCGGESTFLKSKILYTWDYDETMPFPQESLLDEFAFPEFN